MPKGTRPRNCYQREDSPFWWYEFEIDGNRCRGSTGREDAKSATAFVEAEKTRVRAAATEPKQNVATTVIIGGRKQITLADAIDKFEVEVSCNFANPRDYETSGEWLVQIGPEKLLSQITHEDVMQFVLRRGKVISRRGKRLARSSINREVAHLRMIFNYMRDNRYDIGVPPLWKKLIDQSAEVSRDREMRSDEWERLFKVLSADAPDMIPLVEFSILSGVRLTAAFTLRWDRIDFDTGEATILLKTRGVNKRPHRIPLTAKMIALVKGQPRVHGVPEVFTYQPPRHPQQKKPEVTRRAFTKSTIRKRWCPALVKADVTDFRWHDLRHTAATRVVRATGNLKVAQVLLGHKSIVTTARYAHAYKRDVIEALEAVEKANPAPAEPQLSAATSNVVPLRKQQ